MYFYAEARIGTLYRMSVLGKVSSKWLQERAINGVHGRKLS